MILTSILLVLEVLSSFLLICVILIQKSKGGGLGGSAFGGGAGESLFGARAGNVLTKITIGLSIFFLGNTLILAFIFSDVRDVSVMDSAPISRDILTIPAREEPGLDELPSDLGMAISPAEGAPAAMDIPLDFGGPVEPPAAPPDASPLPDENPSP